MHISAKQELFTREWFQEDRQTVSSASRWSGDHCVNLRSGAALVILYENGLALAFPETLHFTTQREIITHSKLQVNMKKGDCHRETTGT
jgi:hypothetical protein